MLEGVVVSVRKVEGGFVVEIRVVFGFRDEVDFRSDRPGLFAGSSNKGRMSPDFLVSVTTGSSKDSNPSFFCFVLLTGSSKDSNPYSFCFVLITGSSKDSNPPSFCFVLITGSRKESNPFFFPAVVAVVVVGVVIVVVVVEDVDGCFLFFKVLYISS